MSEFDYDAWMAKDAAEWMKGEDVDGGDEDALDAALSASGGKAIVTQGAPRASLPDGALHTAAGQDAIWREMGPITAAAATAMLQDNQIKIEGDSAPVFVDGEQLLLITARLGRPGALEHLFLVGDSFMTLEAIRAAHPAFGTARDPRDYFELQEVGAFMEADMMAGRYQPVSAMKRPARATIVKYDARTVGSGPFPYQYDMRSLKVAREPSAVISTRVYIAREKWADFVNMESVVRTLVQFEPKGAALLLGPAAAARMSAHAQIGYTRPLSLCAAPEPNGPTPGDPAAPDETDESDKIDETDESSEIDALTGTAGVPAGAASLCTLLRVDELQALVKDATAAAERAEAAAAVLRDALKMAGLV